MDFRGHVLPGLRRWQRRHSGGAHSGRGDFEGKVGESHADVYIAKEARDDACDEDLKEARWRARHAVRHQRRRRSPRLYGHYYDVKAGDAECFNFDAGLSVGESARGYISDEQVHALREHWRGQRYEIEATAECMDELVGYLMLAAVEADVAQVVF